MFFRNRLYEKLILNSLQKYKLSWESWSCEDPSLRMFLYKRKYEESHMGYYHLCIAYLHINKKYDWLDKVGGNYIESLISGCYALMNYYFSKIELSFVDRLNTYYHTEWGWEFYDMGVRFLKYKGFRATDWDTWVRELFQ